MVLLLRWLSVYNVMLQVDSPDETETDQSLRGNKSREGEHTCMHVCVYVRRCLSVSQDSC